MAKRTHKALRDNLAEEAELVATLLDAAGGNAPADFQANMRELACQARDLAGFIARIEVDNIPVRVAVVGDFSSGKSSFINSLLQDLTLCPERADPTTSLVTTFTYGPEESILQHHGDGGAIAVSRAHYAAKVQTSKDASAPMYFTFKLPHPLLKGLELVDTPGFNNRANPADSQVTTGIMNDADAFFYLVDANTGTIAETGLERVRLIKNQSNDAEVFLLISKADQKATPDLDGIKARYRKEHAHLFHHRIFTYSSLEPRPDLDSREDLAKLFHAFQRDKAALVRATLKRRLRAHRDLRLTRANPLLDTLRQLANMLEEEAKSREAILTRVFKRLVDVLEGEDEHFFKELADAVFTHVDPTEVKGSGLIWDDAKIIFSPKPFNREVMSFNSFDVMEEAVQNSISTLFGNSREDLHGEIRKGCKAARVRCVQIAEKTTRSVWQLDLDRTFDDIGEAAKRYDEVHKERTLTIYEAVWAEWMTCFDSLVEDIETEFMDAPSEALNRRSKALVTGINRWKKLIDTMPEPKF